MAQQADTTKYILETWDELMKVHGVYLSVLVINVWQRKGEHEVQVLASKTLVKSTMHKLLVNLISPDRRLSDNTEITEQELDLLKALLDNQKDYKTLKRALQMLETTGRDECISYLKKASQLKRLKSSLETR